MKNKFSKFVVLGAVGIVAAVTIKTLKDIGSVDLQKNKERLLSKRENIEKLKEVKNVCNEKINKIYNEKIPSKLPKKVQSTFDKLNGSLFNKQSSTSVVFGNPIYNLYSRKEDNNDGQE